MQIPVTPRRWARPLALATIVVLVLYSLYLALARIYQVDEAQNVFTARILASHWESGHSLWIEIWHLWPLSWLALWNPDAIGLYHASRLLMLAIFWANIGLTALNCGIPLRSEKFLWVFLGAATLSPVWDYGFEIRHDNLLVFLLLALLYGFRMKHGHPRRALALLGALAGLSLFITIKSAAYWMPLALLALVAPDPAWRLPRGKVLLYGGLGLLAAIGVLMAALVLSGRMPAFVDSIATAMAFSMKAQPRRTLWATLDLLLRQSPLLVAVALAALGHALGSLRGRWREGLAWDGLFPEAFLVLTSLGLLAIHPFPLPYHLCLLMPFVYILAVRWALRRPEQLKPGPLWACLILVVHVLPFTRATLRHLNYTNERQEKVMAMAEAMTDPAQDRVYDAAGLVASRQSIGKLWFLHTMFIEKYRKGELPSVEAMLRAHPASVVIPSVRFSEMKPSDFEFINSNYVALAGDFWVLGQILKGPDPDFACLQAGNYSIVCTPPGPLALDGTPIPPTSVRKLSTGVHTFKAGEGTEVSVTWLGPRLTQVPNLGEGDSKRFFFNWY